MINSEKEKRNQKELLKRAELNQGFKLPAAFDLWQQDIDSLVVDQLPINDYLMKVTPAKVVLRTVYRRIGVLVQVSCGTTNGSTDTITFGVVQVATLLKRRVMQGGLQ